MKPEENFLANREAALHAIVRSAGLDTPSKIDSVAAAIDYRVAEAVKEERERIAKWIEHFKTDQPSVGVTYWGEGFAKIIRKGDL